MMFPTFTFEEFISYITSKNSSLTYPQDFSRSKLELTEKLINEYNKIEPDVFEIKYNFEYVNGFKVEDEYIKSYSQNLANTKIRILTELLTIWGVYA